MYNCDISVILPGIRPQFWGRFYDSVQRSTSRRFEVIIISPYDLPSELSSLRNIKIIRDFGCITRCQNIGLINAEGKYFTWGSDDSVFLERSIDKCIDILESMGGDKLKNIVTAKYIEELDTSVDMPLEVKNMLISKKEEMRQSMMEDKYYVLNNHQASQYSPTEYLMLNVGFFMTEYALSIGGWDPRFESLPMALNDFAIRCQVDGCQIHLTDFVALQCGWMPNDTGDHGPVHFSMLEHDIPLFNSIVFNQDRVKQDINLWKKVPKIWTRRFGY